MKILMKFITAILLLLLLTACSFIGNSQTNASQTKKIGENAKSTILLFKQGTKSMLIGDEGGLYYGDLYIKTFGEAEEKIANNIGEYNVFYEQESDIVYFIDGEADLYRFSRGKEKEKLASGVFEFNVKRGKVFYYSVDSDGYDLYIVKDNLEAEKIGNFIHGDHTQYEIVDTDLYYVNSNYDLKLYNIVSQTESLLASDVREFKVLGEKGQLLYTNNDDIVFYKNGKKDAFKVSNDLIDFDSIQYLNNAIYYTSYYDDVAFRTELTDSMKTTQLATEVDYFEVVNQDIYYLGNDGNLFVKKEKDAEPQNIISDLDTFTIKNNNIFYLKDRSLFKTTIKNPSEQVNLTKRLSFYSFSDSEEIIYSTFDDELYLGDLKLTSDLNGYDIVGDTIIFSTNDRKLYRSDKSDATVVVEEDLSDYSFIYHNNEFIYLNELTFNDLAGYWETYDFENVWHEEADEDGFFWSYEAVDYGSDWEDDDDGNFVHIEFLDKNKLRFITDDEEYEATINDAGFSFIDFELNGYGNFSVILQEEDSIELGNNENGRSFIFERVTQKRIDSFTANQIEDDTPTIEITDNAEEDDSTQTDTTSVNDNDMSKSLYMQSIEYAFELISIAPDAPSFTIGLQEAHEAWDNELNRIYGLLREELSPQKMEALKKEQLAWIESRDKEAGDPEVVGVWTELEIRTDLTKEQTLYLIDMYFAEKE